MKKDIYLNPWEKPSIDRVIEDFPDALLDMPLEQWVQDGVHMQRVVVSHCLEATYIKLYTYAPQWLPAFATCTADFFTMGKQVEICLSESFVGISIDEHPRSATQCTRYNWEHMCDVMDAAFPRCRTLVTPTSSATFLHPYRT